MKGACDQLDKSNKPYKIKDIENKEDENKDLENRH